MFVRSMVALLAQPLMGDLIDKTRSKREYAVLSNVVVALTCLSFVFYLNYSWVLAAMTLQGIA